MGICAASIMRSYRIRNLLIMVVGLALVLPLPIESAFGSEIYVPPGKSGWEKHKTNPWEIGARTTFSLPNPSVVLTGTDWWWARSFVYNAVYAVNTDYGAVGAGTAKYIPLGSSNAIFRELKYEWNSVASTQGYIFSGSGPTQSPTTYSVYYNGLGQGCWLRYTSSQQWDSNFCISGFVKGHPVYQASTNTSDSDSTKNSIVGTYTTVQYKEGTSWKNFTDNDAENYCREQTSTSAYKIQLVSGGNTMYLGSTASSNSCSTSYFLLTGLPG